MEHEKVKFPKRLYDALQDYGLPENGNESWPVGTISGLYDQWREEESSVLGTFIDGNADNQWLLIDAVRYGYETEPEPRWGIKAGKFYVNNDYPRNGDQVELDSVIAFAKQYVNYQEAIENVSRLCFGEVVDLNKVGKADD